MLHRYCFFFQAEDGIRVDLVTGVQTCALPIFGLPRQHEGRGDPIVLPRESEVLRLVQRIRDEAHRFAVRSEERRVGKEYRSQWSAYHQKIKHVDKILLNLLRDK